MQTVYRKKRRPSYWSGLLGFIPVAGFVFGIIFLIKGIFTFRDKFLIIIGAACLVFNISIFLTLFIFLRSLPPFDNKPFVSTTQGELNSIVHHIEFYKIHYGNYPDSLEQLKRDGSHINFNDLMQFGKGAKVEYNYKRINDKYLLFSSGIDRIPNTSDDLYPTNIISDSSKFGFIKKKINIHRRDKGKAD